MIKSKRGVISSSQFFFLVFVSRTVVALTYIQAVMVGDFSADILVSFAVSCALSAILSLPCVLCFLRGKSPLNLKLLLFFYAVYFVLWSSLGVSRLSYFAATKMNPQMTMAVLIVFAFIAAGYAAWLGIEGIARFGTFCGVVLVVVLAVVLGCNFDNFNVLNFFPFWQNSMPDMIKNTIMFSANTIEPLLLLVLGDRVNKSPVKPYYFGLLSAYAGIFLLLFFCCGVLGGNANLQAFPIFTLFQMASVYDMSRLDIFHTAFWIFAVFMKSALFIYCTSVLFKRFSHSKKAVLFAVLGAAISLLINYVVGTFIVSVAGKITLAFYFTCVVALPTLSLIFGKEKKND